MLPLFKYKYCNCLYICECVYVFYFFLFYEKLYVKNFVFVHWKMRTFLRTKNKNKRRKTKVWVRSTQKRGKGWEGVHITCRRRHTKHNTQKDGIKIIHRMCVQNSGKKYINIYIFIHIFHVCFVFCHLSILLLLFLCIFFHFIFLYFCEGKVVGKLCIIHLQF